MLRCFLDAAITSKKETQKKKHQAQSSINKTWKDEIKKNNSIIIVKQIKNKKKIKNTILIHNTL
jgi:hypothetical protein